ncbi:putative ribose-phosphate pyrophosphokinase [Golovinomyces cichoracearum]|uniref:Ribose-phosphate pyrophosphokinase 1 n=1 Tax=Golovinomyces cichoracearum TaxID=62708 RepID=A0A420J896_9PEZI|nr:putative ribose-phosphate pyrophosphokinase [Golovinomyces cichoracearum]
MSNILIFAGSSCPTLATSICSRLGTRPAPVELSKFANGETSVKILTSIREKDVFVVQSGSSKINDSIMELLIMISACKGGSANKITAVLPYFPYNRQSKKKSHRGSITARMLANLLSVAGVHHVITIDLHASQMKGFFKCPVDNLHAEPLISRWIRHNILNWQEAVCVSKNAGGTKRVTSLADALKLNFGMITTDKKRGCRNKTSSLDSSRREDTRTELQSEMHHENSVSSHNNDGITVGSTSKKPSYQHLSSKHDELQRSNSQMNTMNLKLAANYHMPSRVITQSPQNVVLTSPESTKKVNNSMFSQNTPPRSLLRSMSSPAIPTIADEDFEFTDEKARDIIQSRLVHGHVVPDDYPSLSQSSISLMTNSDHRKDVLLDGLQNSSSEALAMPFLDTDLPETISDEEENFENTQLDYMITLVGDVYDRTVLIIDDMIDKAGSWIAAAECVVKRGGAKTVYCIATHGLFGGNSLKELQDCDCIDVIVVTNSFPISFEKARTANKLVILDLSDLLSEAIRRNHYGESMSALFTHSYD